jgi:hypothetical protein
MMPNVLSPNQMEMKGMSALKKMHRKRMLEIAGAPDPNDDPIILEIRRRLVGLILESVETNFF